MARAKSSQFKREMRQFPYDIELEDGTVVIINDPGRMTLKDASDLANNTDIQAQFRVLVGPADDAEKRREQFDTFWAEYQERSIDEATQLLEDVSKYYGKNQGKS